jgi:predicted dehydrogenase
MFDTIRCLLIGYGNIGKIHSKYLNLNSNVEWYWYDPFISTNTETINRITSLNDINYKFDKIFIVTPENTHYSIYNEIRSIFDKDIFIEKPAIINFNEFHILNDTKLMVGLVERFNPAVVTLKTYIEINKIINIDFSRCCVSKPANQTPVIMDIAIHDIDLFFYLTNKQLDITQPISMHQKNNTLLLQTYSDISTRFIWSKDTFFKERKIIVRQTDYTYIADLQEQSVVRYSSNNKNQTVSESLFVEKSSPIYNEQQNFLSNKPNYIVGKKSHKFLLQLMDKYNDQ